MAMADLMHESGKITRNYMSLTPAYGRDYRSAKDARDDFLAGKDFVAHDHTGSGYCAIRDFESGVVVNIRYRRQTQVCTVRVP